MISSKTYGVKPTTDSMIYVLDKQGGFVYEAESAPSFSPSFEKILNIHGELAGMGTPSSKPLTAETIS